MEVGDVMIETAIAMVIVGVVIILIGSFVCGVMQFFPDDE